MRIFFVLLFSFLTVSIYGQEEGALTNRPSFGLDLQVYPTGIIPGLRFEHPISNKSDIYFRIGYQIIDHRDLGEQDNEEGNGYGFSLGYKKHFNAERTKWSLMFKNDVWFNTIDWEDARDGDLLTGTTDLIVLQPTLQLEYGFQLGQQWLLSPSAAFGLEWNVKTDGEPTGEGPILLLGVALTRRL